MKSEITLRQIQRVFTTAGEHYEKEIDRLELELIRHREMLNLTQHQSFVRMSAVSKSRLERVEEIEQWLREYRATVCLCKDVKEKCMDISAKEFAEAFDFFKKKKA